MTPASIVAIPTISERKDKPSTKLAVSLKTLPKLNPPNASSSLGFMSFMSFSIRIISIIFVFTSVQ